jgi:hypothetical protein
MEIGTGRLVRAFAVYGLLMSDDSVEVIGIEIDTHLVAGDGDGHRPQTDHKRTTKRHHPTTSDGTGRHAEMGAELGKRLATSLWKTAERCVRDAEVAGSNPAHPTFAQLRGPVIGYTPRGYVAISAVPRVVSKDRRGQSCAGGGFQGACCPRVAKEIGLAAP